MQDIAVIGFFFVFGLGLVLIWVWMAGRMSTRKLRNKIAQSLATHFRSITSKISVKLLGNTGAKLAYHQESNSPFPQLEATILLLDRSNAIAMVYWKVRRRTDQLQIRANLRDLPPLELELTTHREQKRLAKSLKEHPRSLQEFQLDYLTEQFYLLTNNPQAGEALLRQAPLRTDLEALRPYLTRLSISRGQPHLFVSLILVPQAQKPMEKFIFSLAKALHPKRKRK